MYLCGIGTGLQSRYFYTFKELRNIFHGIDSASLCSLAGRYDNPVPSRFLGPIDWSKMPAQCTVHNNLMVDLVKQLFLKMGSTNTNVLIATKNLLWLQELGLKGVGQEIEFDFLAKMTSSRPY